MAQNETVFSNTEAFAAIYFFSYILIILAIIFGAYHFVGRIRLSYQSYVMLDALLEKLTLIQIGKQALQARYDYNSAVSHSMLHCYVSILYIQYNYKRDVDTV